MTRMSFLPLLLAVGPTAVTAQQAPDARWLPWLGCWQAGQEAEPGVPLVCVRPASDPLGVEMVLVIGKECARVSEAEAPGCIFGITAGNDVSERDWQSADLQWFRAKASDTFGPVGPAIAVGLNPDDVLVETRLNGEVRQHQRTTDLIFNTSEIVSYVSRYVTLRPGDLIFTGTPGSTKAMENGDVVEVEVEGVGVLRNTVRGR